MSVDGLDPHSTYLNKTYKRGGYLAVSVLSFGFLTIG